MGAIRAAETSAAPGTKLAEEEFKNIQALKGIPAEQVIPSMQFIAASLGVECEYCHVAHANEKDDKKPKVTARRMINMMMGDQQGQLRRQTRGYLFSCHRGSAKPVGTPIITDEGPRPADEEGKKQGEAKAVLPGAEQLLDKYLAGRRRRRSLCRKSRAACKRGHSRRSAANISRRKFIPRRRASAFQ